MKSKGPQQSQHWIFPSSFSPQRSPAADPAEDRSGHELEENWKRKTSAPSWARFCSRASDTPHHTVKVYTTPILFFWEGFVRGQEQGRGEAGVNEMAGGPLAAPGGPHCPVGPGPGPGRPSGWPDAEHHHRPLSRPRTESSARSHFNNCRSSPHLAIYPPSIYTNWFAITRGRLLEQKKNKRQPDWGVVSAARPAWSHSTAPARPGPIRLRPGPSAPGSPPLCLSPLV